jgi:hypothetical protein
MLLSGLAADAFGQSPGAFSSNAPPATGPGFRQPGAYERLASGNNPALNFFGGTKSLRHTPRVRQTPMPAPRPVQTAPIAKPFSSVQQASYISPYLALDTLETSTSLPNYLLYVRPQLQQQAQFRAQQAENWRLQQQLRTTQAGGAVTAGPSGGIPTTGHSAQFMNIGGYYPGLR